MNDSEYLEAYYNKVIHCEGMPSFEDLPNDYKEYLPRLQGFAQWALNESADVSAERMEGGYDMDGLKVFVFVMIITIAFVLLGMAIVFN